KALIPDTSGNEIHIQYLGFLEDFAACGNLSWGSAVLAYLYRQLTWAALKKKRKWMGGCLHLLQLWCWERFHVAGPIHRPPLNRARDVCFGARWHRRLTREAPNRTWEFYTNEFDVIEESQIIWELYVLEDLSHVAAICRESSELWWAHVPMFCMVVIEEHMPERVWRQFGAPQVIPPAPERYDRKDGRGHAREKWLLYRARNIEWWNDRANTIMEPSTQEENQSQWRQWYGQQSNLYLTPFSEEPPTEYCPRRPIERALVDVTFRTRELLITNLEASYLDVKQEILKLQEDTLNKLQIKVPEYEQPSIPSGAEYTPGESSGGPNTCAHPWTSEQWPNIYDAQSHGISQIDIQMAQWTQDSGVLNALTPVRVPDASTTYYWRSTYTR
ncbi:hypothetical protein Taro_040851, partial [Colocasia esculenta]|nr:hypothetical protein [Colocasia esculenta]